MAKLVDGLDLAGQKAINLGAPTNPNDGATKTYVDSADLLRMNYKGIWSSASSYAVNDVVTSNGRLYVCTLPQAAGAAPASSAIGVTSATVVGTGGTNVTLPVGSQAGDVALIAMQKQTSSDSGDTTTVPPVGSAIVVQGVGPVSGAATNFGVYSNTLTSTDISNGYLAVPTQTASCNGYITFVYVFRNVSSVSSGSTTTTLVTQSHTPVTNTKYVVSFGGTQITSGASTLASSALSGFLSANISSPASVAGIGYESWVSGATAARTFTLTGSRYGGDFTAAVDVLGLLGSAISATYFTEIATDGMVYRGAYSTGAFSYGDVVLYQNKLYVCTNATTVTTTTFVGVATSAIPKAISTTNVTLPSGSLAGDTVVLAVSYYGSGGLSSSATTLLNTNDTAGGTTQLYAAYKTLTSTDISNGYLAISNANGSAGNGGGLVMYGFRNVQSVDTANTTSSRNSATTVPGTLTGPAFVVDFCVDSVAPSNSIVPTPPVALSSPASGAPSSTDWHGATGGGYESYPAAGTTTARAFTNIYANTAVISVPLLTNGGAPSSASFVEIAAAHDSSGRLQSAEPASPTDVATKNYVDTGIPFIQLVKWGTD